MMIVLLLGSTHPALISEIAHHGSRISELRVSQLVRGEDPALAIDETHVEALRWAGQGSKLTDQVGMLLLQYVRIVSRDEVEHFHEMLVVIERRQRATPLYRSPMRLIVGIFETHSEISCGGYRRAK